MKKPAQIIKTTAKQIGEETLQTVNSRELWQELGSEKRYADWIKYQIETLGLEENFDFEVFHKKVKNPQGGRPESDYIISLDAAKHIAMASRTQKGKEVRKYFIGMEKYARYEIQQKLDAIDTLDYVKREQKYVSNKQEATTRIMENFIDAFSKDARTIEKIIQDTDSFFILMEAYQNGLEEGQIKNMFVSISETLNRKRETILQSTSEQVSSISNHRDEIAAFNQKTFQTFEEDIKAAQSKLEKETC